MYWVSMLFSCRRKITIAWMTSALLETSRMVVGCLIPAQGTHCFLCDQIDSAESTQAHPCDPHREPLRPPVWAAVRANLPLRQARLVSIELSISLFLNLGALPRMVSIDRTIQVLFANPCHWSYTGSSKAERRFTTEGTIRPGYRV